MITKQEFVKFISAYQEFSDGIDNLDKAITGRNVPTILFEAGWYDAVGRMLDVFLGSHFTDAGCDTITWWLWEDVDHIIYQTVDPDLFNGKTEIKYDVNNIDDLWNYLIKYKKDNFKDV